MQERGRKDRGRVMDLERGDEQWRQSRDMWMKELMRQRDMMWGERGIDRESNE